MKALGGGASELSGQMG